jgi:hypothetical protein
MIGGGPKLKNYTYNNKKVFKNVTKKLPESIENVRP